MDQDQERDYAEERYNERLMREEREPLEDIWLATDGKPIGIRDCGYFHGPDGECTYERFAPAEYAIRECFACGFRWNYGTPADRCPNEAEHEPEDDFSAYPAGADPLWNRCEDCSAEPGEECRPDCLGVAAREDARSAWPEGGEEPGAEIPRHRNSAGGWCIFSGVTSASGQCPNGCLDAPELSPMAQLVQEIAELGDYEDAADILDAMPELIRKARRLAQL